MQTFCKRSCSQKYNYRKHKLKNSTNFRLVVIPPSFKNWYQDHDLLDDIDESTLPDYQRRNSILMSPDPYPV